MHFQAFVIVPGHFDLQHQQSHIEAYVEKLMHPFDENLSVPEYKTKCWCVGTEASGYAKEAINEKVPRDRMQQTLQQDPMFMELSKAVDDERLSRPLRVQAYEEKTLYVRAFWKPRDDMELELYKEHPRTDMPRMDCDSCLGTGIVTSSSNPQGHWDWYVFGGRWGGVLYDDGKVEKNSPFQHNVMRVSEVLRRGLSAPHTILTPDGTWTQRETGSNVGGMLFRWEHVKNWVSVVREILHGYPECWVCSIDYHS